MYRDLGEIVDLMAQSARHREYSVSDIERLILPPLVKRQSILIRDEGGLVAFGSWAWLTLEAEEAYRTGSRKLQIGDWDAGDRLWLIDAIAPYGHARPLTTAMREAVKGRRKGKPVFFRRWRTDGRARRYSEVLI